LKDEGGRIRDEVGTQRDLKYRTRDFALRIIRLYSGLPKSTEAQVLGKQQLRSGTSVGAHWREGIRARSDVEFVSKVEGGLQELEESLYWMELLIEAGIVKADRSKELTDEANELMAILVSCAKKVKSRVKRKKAPEDEKRKAF